VRLAFGWAGVFTAAATGLYGWKTDFEKSKPGVWAGFILQVFTLKSSRSLFYLKYLASQLPRPHLPSDIILLLRGGRYRLCRPTEDLFKESQSEPSFTPLIPLISVQIITERITISSRTLPVPSSKLSLKPSPTNSPSYSLSINYVQSTSGGKSLLAKGRTQEAKEYSAFFDEKGVMAQEVFERWIGELVEAVMEGKGA
jgi:signal peptidase complex subunit 2